MIEPPSEKSRTSIKLALNEEAIVREKLSVKHVNIYRILKFQW